MGSNRGGAAGRTMAWAVLLAVATLPLHAGAELATTTVKSAGAAGTYAAEGVVEAVRQSELAAQVSGRITALAVKAGDRVARGQVLLRIDAEVADQQAAASGAQVAQADAMLEAARSEFERSQRLVQKQYLSQAAMERAQQRYRSAVAQAEAMRAQAGVASAGVGQHTVLAPYGGIVAAVAVERGDMALPGKPLLTIFDPAALRVVAQIPESVLPALQRDAPVQVEFPQAAADARAQRIARPTLLPTIDPVAHSAQLRIDLPQPRGLVPGAFARVTLALRSASAVPTLPRGAIVTRSELDAVYVVDEQGRAHLRQVRVGRVFGDEVEILAGLKDAERVALDPAAVAAQSK